MAKSPFNQHPFDHLPKPTFEAPALTGLPTGEGGGRLSQPAGAGAGPVTVGDTPSALWPLFEASARKYQVPVNVLLALAHQESRFNPQAVGPQTQWGTAKGMMQYIDPTAQALGIDPFDPAQAVDAAARQFKERLAQGYSVQDAIMAHHGGDDRRQWGPKTQRYGSEVYDKALAFGQRLRGGLPTAEAAPEGASQVSPEQLERSWGEAFQDTAVSFGIGAGGLVKIGGSIYGLFSGDMDNWGTQTGEATSEFYQARQSPALQQRKQQRQAAIDASEGQLRKFVTAFGTTVTDPLLFPAFLTEQIPNLVSIGAIGRLLGYGAAALGARPGLVGAAAVGGGLGAGAMMQGADAGGEAHQRLLALDGARAQWAGNESYRALVASGMPEQQARETVALELARLAAIKSGIQSLVVNGLVPGARTLERVLGGAPRAGGGMLTGAAKGLAGEAVAEGSEEAYGQLVANQAVQAVDPQQALTEGVGQAAADGALFGVPGAVAGAVDGHAKAVEEQQRPAREFDAAVEQALAAASGDPLIDAVRALDPNQGPLTRAAQAGAQQAATELEINKSTGAKIAESDDPMVGRVITLDGTPYQVLASDGQGHYELLDLNSNQTQLVDATRFFGERGLGGLNADSNEPGSIPQDVPNGPFAVGEQRLMTIPGLSDEPDPVTVTEVRPEGVMVKDGHNTSYLVPYGELQSGTTRLQLADVSRETVEPTADVSRETAEVTGETIDLTTLSDDEIAGRLDRLEQQSQQTGWTPELKARLAELGTEMERRVTADVSRETTPTNRITTTDGVDISELFDDVGKRRFPNSKAVQDFKAQHGIELDVIRELQKAHLAGEPISMAEAKAAGERARAERDASREHELSPEGMAESDAAHQERLDKEQAELDAYVAESEREIGPVAPGKYRYHDDDGHGLVYELDEHGTVWHISPDGSDRAPKGVLHHARHGNDSGGVALIARIRNGELVKVTDQSAAVVTRTAPESLDNHQKEFGSDKQFVGQDGKPKWFGSKPKALAFLEKNGAEASHEVRKVGNKWEIHPLASQSTTGQPSVNQIESEAPQAPPIMDDRLRRKLDQSRQLGTQAARDGEPNTPPEWMDEQLAAEWRAGYMEVAAGQAESDVSRETGEAPGEATSPQEMSADKRGPWRRAIHLAENANQETDAEAGRRKLGAARKRLAAARQAGVPAPWLQEIEQLIAAAEAKHGADTITPFADWRGDLMKTRDYANQLRKAGKLDGDAALRAWSDVDALTYIIDSALGNKPKAAAKPQADVPRETGEAAGSDSSQSTKSASPLDEAASKMSEGKRKAYEELQALLKARRGNLNSGIDPELMLAVAKAGAYSIAEGAVKFAKFVRDMVQSGRDMGFTEQDISALADYLKEAYGAIAANPEKYQLTEEQAEQMDDLRTVRRADMGVLMPKPEPENDDLADNFKQKMGQAPTFGDIRAMDAKFEASMARLTELKARLLAHPKAEDAFSPHLVEQLRRSDSTTMQNLASSDELTTIAQAVTDFTADDNLDWYRERHREQDGADAMVSKLEALMLAVERADWAATKGLSQSEIEHQNNLDQITGQGQPKPRTARQLLWDSMQHRSIPDNLPPEFLANNQELVLARDALRLAVKLFDQLKGSTETDLFKVIREADAPQSVKDELTFMVREGMDDPNRGANLTGDPLAGGYQIGRRPGTKPTLPTASNDADVPRETARTIEQIVDQYEPDKGHYGSMGPAQIAAFRFSMAMKTLYQQAEAKAKVGGQFTLGADGDALFTQMLRNEIKIGYPSPKAKHLRPGYDQLLRALETTISPRLTRGKYGSTISFSLAGFELHGNYNGDATNLAYGDHDARPIDRTLRRMVQDLVGDTAGAPEQLGTGPGRMLRQDWGVEDIDQFSTTTDEFPNPGQLEKAVKRDARAYFKEVAAILQGHGFTNHPDRNGPKMIDNGDGGTLISLVMYHPDSGMAVMVKLIHGDPHSLSVRTPSRMILDFSVAPETNADRLRMKVKGQTVDPSLSAAELAQAILSAAGLSGDTTEADVSRETVKPTPEADVPRETTEATADVPRETTEATAGLAAFLLPRLADIQDNRQLKAALAEFHKRPVGEISPQMQKDGQEALELALVMQARQIVAEGESDAAIFAALVELYNNQPNLNVRSSTSMENQAYSTPAPLAFVASRLAGIDAGTRVYEPTAGNGMLLIAATPELVTANELNELRAAQLFEQGFRVSRQDATRFTPPGAPYDVTIMNPPFGRLKDEQGKPAPVKVDGYTIKAIDHLIASQALTALKDDGRAVLILGASKAAGEIGAADRVFFNWLYSHYNVINHFEVDGRLYQRQGAGWPVRVLVIDGRRNSDTISPVSGSIERANNWNEVYEQFNEGLDARPGRTGTSGTAAVDSRGQPDTKNEPANPGATDDRQDGVADQSGQGGRGGRSGTAGTRAGTGVGGRTATDPETDGTSDSGNRKPGQPAVLGGHVADPAATDRQGPRAAGPADPGQLAKRPADGDRKPSVVGSDYQVAYQAKSAGFNEAVLTPVNMAEATERALTALEAEVGNLDHYVMDALGYASEAELHDAFMGLQVDTVAAGIYNSRRGKGLIIADQTGVGKGRQAAGMLRYALREGKLPVFITVKDNLFTDMYNDLKDIGSSIKPFILNQDGVIKDGDAVLFKNPSSKRHNADIQHIIDTGQLPDGHDMLFLTYSQLNRANQKRTLLDAIKDNAFFVLDESHNAAGERTVKTKAGERITTAGFIYQLIDNAPVVYLSATYAKRPDNMPVYYRTDLLDAVDSVDELVTAVAAGGMPLQSVMSAMLAESGQLFRRERSFKGISVKTLVDTTHTEQHIKFADTVTQGLRAITEADHHFHEHFVPIYAETQQQLGGNAQGAGNQASSGVDHTNFTSIVHNFISQLLLGLKAQKTAELAIELHRQGAKPVIALENTMGSFLAQYVEENGLAVGDVISADYRDILQRALDRTRRISVTAPNGDKAAIDIPLAQLDDSTRALYLKAQKIIQALDIDALPISPIDYLRNQLTQAGIEVSEITGRGYRIDYSSGEPVLAKRDTDEINDRRGTVDAFNDGRLNVLVLNAAGSTGLSIHASEKFADQSPRHMLVMQAMADINVLMQMLGRINRTGQVVVPSFTMMSLNLPTEKRPIARTAAKLKSLNANTSANTDSDTSIEVVDMLNKYGDQVVNGFLKENLDIAKMVKIQPTSGDAGEPGLATKFTGRMALLPVALQQEIYDEIEAAYDSLIEYLNKTEQNDLVPTTVDLDARILASTVAYEGKAPDTLFGGHTFLHKVDAKAQGKPPTPEDVKAELVKTPDPQAVTRRLLVNKQADTRFADNLAERLRKAETERDQLLSNGQPPTADQPEHKPYQEADEQADSLRQRLEETEALIDLNRNLLGVFTIGNHIRLKLGDDNVTGVVVGLKDNHKPGKGNPYALSKTVVSFMVNSGIRQVELPLSKLTAEGDIFLERLRATGDHGLEDLFDTSAPGKQRRETRFIATHNLIAGSAKLKGRIITFTDHQGAHHQGILLPRNYQNTSFVMVGSSQNFALRNNQALVTFLANNRAELTKIGVGTANGLIRLQPIRDDLWQISLPKANKDATVRAVKFNGPLRAAMGSDFLGSGSTMTARFGQHQLAAVVPLLTELTTLYALPSFRDAWVEAGGQAAPTAVNSFSAAPDAEPTPDSPADTPRFKLSRAERLGERLGLSGVQLATSAPIQGMRKAEVQRLAEQFLGDYRGPHKLDLRVGQHQQEIYGESASIDTYGYIQGGYHSVQQVVTLVADHLPSPAAVRQTLRHEILGHYGLDTFAPADRRAILQRVLAAKQHPSLQALWQQISEDEYYRQLPALQQAEEVFAHVVEEESGVLATLVDILRALLTKAARAVGFAKGGITRAEIRLMVLSIARGIRRGKRRQQSTFYRGQLLAAGQGRLKHQDSAFQRWFGDSKIVDDAGQPLVMYHGTRHDFSVFEPSQQTNGLIFFTEHPEVADQYADGRSGGYGELGAAEELVNVKIQAKLHPEAFDGALLKPGVALDTLKTILWDVDTHFGGLPLRKLEAGLISAEEAIAEFNEAVAELVRVGSVMPVYIKADNPAGSKANPIPWRFAEINGARHYQKQGHDGVWVTEAGGVALAVFEPNQIKSAVGNNGDFDPNHKDIRFRRRDVPARKEVDNWFSQQLTNLDSKLLALAPMDRIIKELAGSIPSLQGYLRLKRTMDAYRNKKHSEYDQIAQHWLKLLVFNPSATQQLADVMHQSTLEGIDPSEPYVPEVSDRERERYDQSGHYVPAMAARIADDDAQQEAHERLRTLFNQLPKEHQQLFRTVRDSYRQQSHEYDKILLDNIGRALELQVRRADRDLERARQEITDQGLQGPAKAAALEKAEKAHTAKVTKLKYNKMARLAMIRAQFEANKLRGPYFPLARFGDYFVTARNDKGAVVSFSLFEKSGQQQAFAAELRDEGLRVQVGVMNKKDQVRKAVNAAFLADVSEILDEALVGDEVMDEIWQKYLESLPDLSMRKHKIHRKGREGYHGDALRAFSSQMFHAAHQMARMKYGQEMTDMLDEAADQVKDGSDPVRDGQVLNEINERHQFVMNPTGSAAAQQVTSAAFIFYLGLNPGAAVVNMSQTVILGIPILGAQYGYGATQFQLLRAMKDFTAGLGHAEHGKLSAEEKAAMQRAYDSGLIDKTQSHDLAGVGESGVKYNPVRTKVMAGFSFLFHHAERFNREVTFLAAYRLARKQLAADAAFQQASELTWKTHFDYQNTNRPRVMHSDAAKILLVFRNYNINMLWRLVRDSHQLFAGESKEVRREARHQLGAITALMALNAGITGTWLYGLTMMMANLVSGGDDAGDELRKGAIELLGPTLAGTVLDGLPGYALDISLSERVGIPDLWFRSPDRQLEGRDEYSYWLGQLAGASLGIVERQFVAVQFLKDGHPWRALETASPAFVRNWMRAYRYATEGALNLNGDPIVTQDEFTTGDIFWQAMGFTPAIVAEQYDRNRTIKNKEQKILKARQDAMKKMALGIFTGDDQLLEAGQAAWDSYNDQYQDNPITSKNMTQSLRARMRASANSIDGITVQPRLAERLQQETSPSIYRRQPEDRPPAR